MGLTGKDIPLGARIVSVVDAFVATLETAGDYHDVVATVSELDMIARRARVLAI
jgi:response regulator RpfG family c-di-GMP phosphodiesterase